MQTPLPPTKMTARLASIALFIIMIVVICRELELHLPDLEKWIAGLGAFAPLGFVALFVLLTPFFVSVDALCFAAGLLFSLGWAQLCIAIATYLAAALIFLLGRHLFKEKVRAFVARHERFAALDSILNSHEFKLMLLLRLTPLPFAMLSYALSVTQVGFWPYLGATSGILVYNASLVYIGYSTKHLSGLLTGSLRSSEHVSYPLLAAGLVLALFMLIYSARAAAIKLSQNSKCSG